MLMYVIKEALRYASNNDNKIMYDPNTELKYLYN